MAIIDKVGAWFALIVVLLALRPVAAQTCVGDCKGEGKVDITDLIIGVNIALGSESVTACKAFANADGQVNIAQLIQGVNNALNGCGRPITPSVTATAPSATTATPTSTLTSPPANSATATPPNPPTATETSTSSSTKTATPPPTAASTATPTGTLMPSTTPASAPTNTATATATASASHFVDNGDGTITDTQTGLIWEKKDQGGGLHDSNTRYPSAGICTDNGDFCQPDAAAATTCNAATGGAMGCAQCGGAATCHTIIGSTTIWDWLNQINAASFAGHSDWRIPTVGRDGGTVQLETLVDTSVSGCGSGVPCVPPAFNTGCVAGCMATGCSCTQADSYWSATPIVGNLPFPSAWGVFFRTGEVEGLDKASAFYVRAVRGGL
jgi:hypothetical protein